MMDELTDKEKRDKEIDQRLIDEIFYEWDKSTFEAIERILSSDGSRTLVTGWAEDFKKEYNNLLKPNGL